MPVFQIGWMVSCRVNGEIAEVFMAITSKKENPLPSPSHRKQMVTAPKSSASATFPGSSLERMRSDESYVQYMFFTYTGIPTASSEPRP